jgi:SAM-dependent methyltransferase
MEPSSNLRFYERFAEAYQFLYAQVDEDAAVERWVRLLEDLRLIQTPATRLQGPPAILDVGCGPGRHLIAWHKRGFRPTGLDGSRAMLSVAERNLRSAGIRCPLVPANILTFDNLNTTETSFPIVASHLFFPNLFPSDELGLLMLAIAKLLAPAGIWIADWRTGMPETLPSRETIDIGGSDWTRANAFDPITGAFVQSWSVGSSRLEERFWNHELPEIEIAASRAGLRVLLKTLFSETPASLTLILQK